MTKNKDLYKRKLHSLDELEDEDIIIIDKSSEQIKNNLKKILTEKKLLPIDLATLIGVTKQSINSIINSNVLPSVGIALKISYTLQTPIETIFEMSEDAWIRPYVINDKPMYLDKVNLEVIEVTLVKEFIKSTSFEYYDMESKKYISKKDRNILWKEYTQCNQENELLKVKSDNQNYTLREAKSVSFKNLESKFNERYIKIFYRLGKRITPYII